MDSLFYHDAWDVAALFDGAGNVIQWEPLIAEDTGFSEELIEQDTTNSSYQSGVHQQLMLACSDYDGHQQLIDWRLAKTPLQAVVISKQGNGRNCRWTEPVALMENTDQPKGDRSDGDSYLKAVLEEYDAEAARYHNLMYNVGGTSIVLPLGGPTLTLSAAKASAYTLTLEAFDYGTDGTNGASVGSSTANISSGRGSVELLLPANTWKVQWSLDGATDAALRADGGTEYIAG